MTDTLCDPRLAGYRKWEGFDTFEEQTGPFYFREDDGEFRCAVITCDQQMSSAGAMHGGALMTFADYSLFVFARPCFTPEISAVTVSFSADFTAAAGPGEFLESTGEVVRETGSLIFVRGKIFRGNDNLLSFSGVLKKIRLRE